MHPESIESVGFARGSRVADDGLVQVHEPPSDLSIGEAAVIRDVQAFNGILGLKAVDYVFFRRFDDGRPSQAAAFIIDNSDERLSESTLALVHHDLWLHGATPLIYVAWPTRIDVLTCARGPDFWKKGNRRYVPADEIDVSSKLAQVLDKRRRYSALRLADGTFWEDPRNQPLAYHPRTAHESLIRALVETDHQLNGDQNPVARRLLLLTVLLQYLEDRGVFPGNGWFGRFQKGARSFLEVLAGEDRRASCNCCKRLKRSSTATFSLYRRAPG